jgi:signal transduction histidine kinase
VEENGTVKVSLKSEGSMCRIDVHNTGNVIPADDLPHLFDRFYRADKARTRGTGGFGLGLAIAQSIVEAHGGTIGVTSTEADGTTFTVHLPSE